MSKPINLKIAPRSGPSPETLIHRGLAYCEKIRITLLTYNVNQAIEEEIGSFDELPENINNEGVMWIKVVGLQDVDYIEKLGKHFSIHPLVLEDILNTNHRPKYEDYGDYIYIVMKSFNNGEKEGGIEADQISLVVGKGYVISFEERENELFLPLVERILDARGRIRKMGADYLAYALIDVVVDHYFVVLEAIGEVIESLEDALVTQPGPNALLEIHELKRQMLIFRKALWPLREVAVALSRGESPLIGDETVVYLRDVYDHTVQVLDSTETYRDILSGMLDIYLSSISNRMNLIMKVLTILSTIFMPITFIAGVYGMNFRYMPELEWPWAYPAVLVLMLTICLVMIRFFKIRGWL